MSIFQKKQPSIDDQLEAKIEELANSEAVRRARREGIKSGLGMAMEILKNLIEEIERELVE